MGSYSFREQGAMTAGLVGPHFTLVVDILDQDINTFCIAFKHFYTRFEERIGKGRTDCAKSSSFEPPREKTNKLHMRKQRHRSASR